MQCANMFFADIFVASYEGNTRGTIAEVIGNRAIICTDVIAFGSRHRSVSVAKRITHLLGDVGVV